MDETYMVIIGIGFGLLTMLAVSFGYLSPVLQKLRSKNAIAVEPKTPGKDQYKMSSLTDREGAFERILKVHFGGEFSLFEEVAQSFISTLEKQMSSLHQSIVLGEYQEVQRLAHKLRGSISNFSWGDSSRILIEIETHGRLKNQEGLLAEFDKLRSATKDLIKDLKTILDKRSVA